MPTIEKLRAMEILDSRGRPTIKCWCTLNSGATAAASVPSGASTGKAEAHELRDGDPARFSGLGCLRAVENVDGEIAKAVSGRHLDQVALDRMLIELDGTNTKSRLGANAILAISLAFARASASERNLPLYHYFQQLIHDDRKKLPRTTINLFSGGKHAGGQVVIQDLLVVPAQCHTIRRSLEIVYAVYQSAVKLIGEKYQARALKADEGGLAPPFPDAEAMISDAVEAIRRAGFHPGRDVALAVDVAASHFFSEGAYRIADQSLSGEQMIDLLDQWTRTYPIVSVEDGLAEGDWKHWRLLSARLDKRCLIVGDDLLCTNPQRIAKASAEQCSTALLLKVNQIGTLTEAAEARRLARAAGWNITVSARSGETEDNWLADLAVAWGDQIKVGSICQSERLAKYNRLLEIEAETSWPVVTWPNPEMNGT